MLHNKDSQQKKALVIPILFILLMVFGGIFAITQETDEDSGLDETPPVDSMYDLSAEEWDEEGPPGWIPPGPPRWFRSNAGGMTLEEIPSQLAALRNAYALVIDYVAPDELEPRLAPHYRDNYIIEIRILFKEKEVARRQWLFRDESGITRLNAVFVQHPPAATADEQEDAVETDDKSYAIPEPPVAAKSETESAASTGFIEIYNNKSQIVEDHRLFDDDSEIIVTYSYKDNVLVKAETLQKLIGSNFRRMYTDDYRYNRSYSLRHIERLYHAETQAEPVRIVFPGRVLEAAADTHFLSDKLPFTSDFLDSFSAGEGFRMLYDTDSRGRILAQTMINDKDEKIWVITNTWSGDRITAIHKIEGDNEKLTEYEYDDAGNRIVQRDIQNGALERQVFIAGENETEELYLNGVLVIKAYWENGRKVSEERVRRR